MAKKTREELAEIEYRALEEAMREMQAFQEAEESSETSEAVIVPAEPAPEKPKRTRKPRAKKETASEGEAAAEKPKRTRKPGKKTIVPNFVIQNTADNEITYDAVVQKVHDAVTVQEITSIEIYVKAEEGKAYYVVNGEAAGAVDLF